MSHTVRKVNLGNTALADITIVDYVAGGETFTLAELGLTGSVLGVFMINMISVTAAGFQSSPRFTPELFSGGVVKIMDNASGATTEIPSTVGLNFSFLALIRGS